MRDVLVRSLAAFEIIGLEQAFGAIAIENRREFPREVFRVLNAGIGTTRAERRDLMCGIAREDHAPCRKRSRRRQRKR